MDQIHAWLNGTGHIDVNVQLSGISELIQQKQPQPPQPYAPPYQHAYNMPADNQHPQFASSFNTKQNPRMKNLFDNPPQKITQDPNQNVAQAIGRPYRRDNVSILQTEICYLDVKISKTALAQPTPCVSASRRRAASTPVVRKKKSRNASLGMLLCAVP